MKTYEWAEIVDDGSIADEFVPADVAQRMYEALVKIDKDLESRNFLENSSLRDTARDAIVYAQ